MENMEQLLAEQPLFAALEPKIGQIVSGCARNCRFEAGAYVFHEGDAANEFYLIRHGRVALEVAAAGQSTVVFNTLGPGEVLGASWLIPPYKWMFDARAVELTRAIGIDAKCLRGKCEADHDLGYEMMKRFLPVFVRRLHETRLQILDVYGKRGK
jgi:CRP-like cAMP-binding protein